MPAWALEGGSGATPPAPPPTGPPTAGLIFWVKGDAGLTSVAGAAVSWADQSGFGQDVTDLPSNPGPLTGLDTIDGIPCVTCPLGNMAGRGLYRAAPNGLLDRNGVPIGYGPGQTQARTVMAMILPRFSPGAFNITGGLVVEMGSNPTFQPIFDLEDTISPDQFYAFSTGWRNPGSGALQYPDVAGGAGGIYNGVPTLVSWQSTGFDNISSNINDVPKTLTPSVIPGAPAASTTSFALLRAISGGLSFQGAAAEFLIWDFDLTTDPAGYAQAVAYMANRYPSAPIV
jgi:hypothetical protein